jgi:hypothetical protein
MKATRLGLDRDDRSKFHVECFVERDNSAWTVRKGYMRRLLEEERGVCVFSRQISGIKFNPINPIRARCDSPRGVLRLGSLVFLPNRAMESVSDSCVGFERFSVCHLIVGGEIPKRPSSSSSSPHDNFAFTLEYGSGSYEAAQSIARPQVRRRLDGSTSPRWISAPRRAIDIM